MDIELDRLRWKFFAEMKKGDVFSVGDGAFIKINDVFTNKTKYNAVNIFTGDCISFFQCAEVEDLGRLKVRKGEK